MTNYTRTFFALLMVVIGGLLVSGCTRMGVTTPPGLIYQQTASPMLLPKDAPRREFRLSENYRTGTATVRMFVPWRRFLSIGWGDCTLEEAMKNGNMNEVYFADVQTLKVIGLYEGYTITAYGE